jgi:hypothetical protein
MKKVISIFALFMGINMISFAQTPTTTSWTTVQHVLVEGQNTARFPDGSRCKFMFNINTKSFSQVALINQSGKRIAVNDPVSNIPPPPPACEGNLRCVFNSKYNTYICFCMPDLYASKTVVASTIMFAAES